MTYLISIIIGYLLGSVPTAYLILKSKGLDITSEGTGNVGAMNAFEVTNSKIDGLLVFFIDALKGLLSVFIPLLIFPHEFALNALGLLSAVLAHCYNPWLKFKGGRGLSTAFGGTILLSPLIPAIWVLSWAVIFLIKKDILLGNIIANFVVLFGVCLFNSFAFNWSQPTPDSISSLILFTFSLMILIFIRHLDPFLELLNKKNKVED